MTERNPRPQTATPLTRLSAHPNRFRWPEHLVGLLGQVADEGLALLAGVHPQTVTKERRRRGLPAYKPHRAPIDWTPEMIALLGTNSDRVIAAVLGVVHGSVFRKRRVLGIAPYVEPVQKEPPGFTWTTEAVALLGTQSDRRVAQLLGISATSVHNKRRLLGIPSYHPPHKRITWTAEMIGLLGTRTDVDCARRFRMTKDSVKLKRDELGIPAVESKPAIARTAALAKLLQLPNRELRTRYDLNKGTALKLRREFGIRTPDGRNRRWTAARRTQLGQQPDARLAKKMGLTPGAVGAKRRTLGIPPQVRKRRWSEAELARLGRRPDREVAVQTARSVSTVKAKRRTLGIAAMPAAPRHHWSEAERVRLGTVTDRALADELGLSPREVTAQRYTLGIAACQNQNIRWRKGDLARLGKLADRKLAAKLGLSDETVRRKRCALGIPAWQPHKQAEGRQR